MTTDIELETFQYIIEQTILNYTLLIGLILIVTSFIMLVLRLIYHITTKEQITTIKEYKILCFIAIFLILLSIEQKTGFFSNVYLH